MSTLSSHCTASSSWPNQSAQLSHPRRNDLWRRPVIARIATDCIRASDAQLTHERFNNVCRIAAMPFAMVSLADDCMLTFSTQPFNTRLSR